MKFRVDRDVLADAVAWAARSLPVRPSVPVLAGLLIEAGHEVGLGLPEEQLRPGAGSGQERVLLRALAWVGFEREREEAAA